MKIYLAGPLFSLSEKRFNKELANELEKKIKNCFIVLPQEFSNHHSGGTEEEKLNKIFKLCMTQIEESDIIIAILEGPDVDSGTCIELGYAYSKKKPIVGIRTDFRSSEDNGVNLMVSKVCSKIIRDMKTESIEKLANEVKESINKVINK